MSVLIRKRSVGMDDEFAKAVAMSGTECPHCMTRNWHSTLMNKGIGRNLHNDYELRFLSGKLTTLMWHVPFVPPQEDPDVFFADERYRKACIGQLCRDREWYR